MSDEVTGSAMLPVASEDAGGRAVIEGSGHSGDMDRAEAGPR